MVFVQKSFHDGLGRHMWYLSSDEKKRTLKNLFTSQPLAVIASMISRSGMMCFLYNCFNSADKQVRMAIIACMAMQVVINMVTVVQIVVQCGPAPYHASDRVSYFHYMWDNLPADGSVTCQSPSVQTTIGYVQGGFNSSIDFLLTILSAAQLWRFTLRATYRGPAPRLHLCARIRKMPKKARLHRAWQTVSLSGPLLLSGVASIVKTYLLKSIGDKNDITHNIIPFILWVKIENYSIIMATLAPMIRLCIAMVSKDNEKRVGYWSHTGSKATHPGLELGSRPHTQSKGAVSMSTFDCDDDGENTGDKIDWSRIDVQRTHQRGDSKNKPSKGVTIRTEIVVRVSSEHSTERLV
ncbi:hypothetical protein BDV26DRAFT_302003 [Aspergillus bertholletiae]|uniref:Rhodopsin domain-containing protein n=1 Tax=Aspergillus bertholletiae TaxID=1226010 RepID=A0A5N7BHR1_9EURO|nr:hypothetical protein BDV26DRAFT_302003 [Aspergillus bertholletiae]